MGLFLGFIFCFSEFDGDCVWLLDLDLDLDLVASWIWEENEENFLLVFNLIFSSCFCLCSSDMGLSSWLLGLVSEEHEEQKEQVEEHEYYEKKILIKILN